MRYSPWTSQDAEQVMISRSFITSTCTSSASDGVEATAVRNCTGSWYSASSSFSDRKRSSEINFWRPFMAWRESLLDLDSNASLSGRKHFSLSSCGCNFRVPFRLMNKPSERTKNGPSQGTFLQTHFLEFRSNCMKLTSSRYTRVPHRLCFIRRGIVSKVGQHLLHNVSNPWDPCWRRKILPLWRQLFPFEHQQYLYRDLFFSSNNILIEQVVIGRSWLTIANNRRGRKWRCAIRLRSGVCSSMAPAAILSINF